MILDRLHEYIKFEIVLNAEYMRLRRLCHIHHLPETLSEFKANKLIITDEALKYDTDARRCSIWYIMNTIPGVYNWPEPLNAIIYEYITYKKLI